MTDWAQMVDFLRNNKDARPNAKKTLDKIVARDIVYLNEHPCGMSNPPMVYYLNSLSGEGHEGVGKGEGEEKVAMVRGMSLLDGEERDQLFKAEGGEVEYFIDDHEEREWFVVGLSSATMSRGWTWLMRALL